MPPLITILPLGTASAVPSLTRNHSSLAVILPSSSTLLFDVGEGTQHRIQRFPLKLNKIEKIFITHLHGDHVFGLCPLLATLMNGAGGTADPDLDLRTYDTNAPPKKPRIEIYGPKGLREYIRVGLKLTYTHLGDWYVVHELHFPHDAPSDPTENCYLKEHPSGTNIPQDAQGFWRDFGAWTHPAHGNVEFTISAAEIKHSVPSVGYVLTESPRPGKIPRDYAARISKHKEALQRSGHENPMKFLGLLQAWDCPEDAALELPDGTRLTKPPKARGRRITVLGDTYDPSPITPLAEYSDVLVHEATNAFLPGLDPNTKVAETYETVEALSRSRGHSTPEMAGRFAHAIKLGEASETGGRDGLLILNHFSSRYKDDDADGPDGAAKKIMVRIGECAMSSWMAATELSEGLRVVCARDGVPIEVKA
ncbi:beta-lactamase-like protein [Morchella snyderi]|nr:beta-lactamase-like protein [Morchella snyderi]